MSGFIYLLSNHDAYPGWYKVGRAKDILQRLKGYRSAMPSPYADAWEIEGLWRVRTPVAAEAYVLKHVRSWRLKQDKVEWFKGGTQDGPALARFIGRLLTERFDGVQVAMDQPSLEQEAA